MKIPEFHVNMDIVYVIDATNDGAIADICKNQVAEFADRLGKYCRSKDRWSVAQLREKLVFFGDFATGGKNAIIETEFYDSATQKTEFLKQFDRDDIKMTGGDLPENGLEALCIAMKSDFCKADPVNGLYTVHLIVLVSDAYPLKLGERRNFAGYDETAYPGDVIELRRLWELAGWANSPLSLGKNRRLLLFVPDGYRPDGRDWTNVTGWENSYTVPIKNRNDINIINEACFDEVCNAIADGFESHIARAENSVESHNKYDEILDSLRKLEEKSADKKKKRGSLRQRGGYKIDIAFVIEATPSMAPIMDSVKEGAKVLGDEIMRALERAGKPVEQLRARVIDFSDFASEGDEAIRQTDFFTMPDEKAEFDKAVDNIDYEYRGGDAPENALEALYVAMLSDWVEIEPYNDFGRHFIVLMTASYPLHLMERKGSIGYPADELPSDIAELQSVWDADDKCARLSRKNKRLILFAPEGDDGAGHSWNDVAAWEKTIFNTVNPAKGYVDIALDSFITEIVRTDI